MYDSWDKENTMCNLYVHNITNQKTEDEQIEDMLTTLGFSEFRVLPTPTIENVTNEELTQLKNKLYTPEELLAGIKG